jgi:hypothetical protein
MNVKKILTAALLIFVAVSLVKVIVKHVRLYEQARAEDGAADRDGREKIIVYYFHGRQRCENCRNIEAYAKESVQNGFAKELAEGRIEWQVVDFDVSSNSHFDKDYELSGIPGVVFVKSKGSSQVKYTKLDKVWELVIDGDKAKFLDYVQNELRDFLK